MDKLIALGFTCTGGQIDRDNINYGFLSPDGPVLTPEGETLVKSLTKKPKRSVAPDAPDAMPEAPAEEPAGE